MAGFAWRWLPIVTLASCLLPVHAADVAGEARAWLARIQNAAQASNYQGVLVFSGSGMLSSSRVAHYLVGDNVFERMETLDGKPRRVFRTNDLVQTVWPRANVAAVEQRGPWSTLPSTTQAVEPRALEQYELKLEDTERVAGRDAQVLLLRPRDSLRYAQRVWADKASGLMLRNDVLDVKGAVLESTRFSEVEVGTKPAPESVTQPMKNLNGLRVMRPTMQATQLEAEGWSLARPVAGFRPAGCVKRTLEGPEQPNAAAVLQAVYSDGLTHVSIFVEPGNREPPDLDGLQVGATAALRVKKNDHWVTVLGDVPPATLQAFADALERRR